jgi:hypothetical protein
MDIQLHLGGYQVLTKWFSYRELPPPFPADLIPEKSFFPC